MAQPDVMKLLEKEQGKAPRLSTQQIVKESLRRSGEEDQFGDIYGRMQSALQSPQFRIMRSGNTLLFYKIVKPKDTVEFDIMTADSPRELPNSLKDLMEAMKKAGFKRGIAKTENTNLVNLANSAGIPVQVKIGERMQGDQMMPTQMVEVGLQ